MYISIRNTTKSQLFILHFFDQNTFSRIISVLHKYALTLPNTGDHSLRQDFEDIVSKITERCTDKYEIEPGELTSVLFPDEIANFLTLFMAVCVRGW
jgi:hypothetical protein